MLKTVLSLGFRVLCLRARGVGLVGLPGSRKGAFFWNRTNCSGLGFRDVGITTSARLGFRIQLEFQGLGQGLSLECVRVQTFTGCA